MPLVHHELCFGCGRTNLLGLLVELEPVGAAAPGEVRGRCFIKQDHQGAEVGYAHGGVVAAALLEAMSFAAARDRPLERLAVSYGGKAPVGAFLVITARPEGDSSAVAAASADGRRVASARCRYA